ncbi:MAG: discoidin domain-containing protein [Lentisphaeria bacterium]|nr:discoidin domain-containing protein [Lentisphaeria bacterium]
MIKDYGLQDYIHTNYDLPLRKDHEWTLVCRLPHNAQFQPWIKVDAEAGKTIEMHSTNCLVQCMQPEEHCETLDGIHSYEVENWISGHGAYYTIPAGVTVLAVKYHETSFDTDFAGAFHCNDEDYNTLWKKATRTCYVCMRDHFMDCPDRERTPTCLGDVAVQIEEVFYAFDTRAHALAKAALLSNKDYTHIVDQNLVFAGESSTWFYYLNTGDLETMATQYPHMKRYLETWAMGADGLNEHKGVPHHGSPEGWDWCDWGSASKDRRIVQCTQYYAALGVLRKMAQVTGNQADIPAIDQRLESIRANFDRHFWQGSFYQSQMVDYPDERANAMAVVTGLASRDKWDSIYSAVISQKMNQAWEGGPTYNADSYFERWIMEALCIMGREEQALLRMHERYQQQIESSFSTLYEGFGRWWKGNFNPGATLNHGWNSPNTILSRYIAGIQPTKPGWEAFSVLPREAFLTHIDATVATIKGDIIVSIRKDEMSYSIDMDVPKGSQATVGIPRKAFSVIDELSQPASSETDDYLLFTLRPGHSKVSATGKLSLSQAKTPAPKAEPQTCHDRKSLTVSASHIHKGPFISYSKGKWFDKQDGSPRDAVDGDLYTFWSTGRPQQGDEWFLVDMGRRQRVSRIELENSWCPYDYPRQFTVSVSDNGETWSDPVATGAGTQSITHIVILPQETRFIRIAQTGQHPKYWWSISDLRIYP